jgi:hypothetical protein
MNAAADRSSVTENQLTCRPSALTCYAASVGHGTDQACPSGGRLPLLLLREQKPAPGVCGAT